MFFRISYYFLLIAIKITFSTFQVILLIHSFFNLIIQFIFQLIHPLIKNFQEPFLCIVAYFFLHFQSSFKSLNFIFHVIHAFLFILIHVHRIIMKFLLLVSVITYYSNPLFLTFLFIFDPFLFEQLLKNHFLIATIINNLIH